MDKFHFPTIKESKVAPTPCTVTVLDSKPDKIARLAAFSSQSLEPVKHRCRCSPRAVFGVISLSLCGLQIKVETTQQFRESQNKRRNAFKSPGTTKTPTMKTKHIEQ